MHKLDTYCCSCHRISRSGSAINTLPVILYDRCERCKKDCEDEIEQRNISIWEEAEQNNLFYKAQTYCLNCGWSGTLTKEKGERVKGTPCPNCECELGMEE